MRHPRADPSPPLEFLAKRDMWGFPPLGRRRLQYNGYPGDPFMSTPMLWWAGYKEGENGLPMKRSETLVLWTNWANLLEKQIHLMPVLLGGDLSYADIFLGIYQAFATAQEVLDLLLTR